jgi:hypothetical protein
MLSKKRPADGGRSLYINLTVVVVFVAVMLGFIRYLNDSTPDMRRLALESLAERFNTGVHYAHWQWQAEGRPEIIMLVTYANRLDNDDKLVATERQPVFMDHQGWPKSDASSKGCAEIWKMVLNLPLEIEGFKVIAEYFDGDKISGNPLDSSCRFRLSTGPYFEYMVSTGQVTKVKS